MKLRSGTTLSYDPKERAQKVVQGMINSIEDSLKNHPAVCKELITMISKCTNYSYRL